MKRFRDIQILLLFFTAVFVAGVISLILNFKTQTSVVVTTGALGLIGLWLMGRAFLALNGYFHAFKQREARLLLLASRDPATGLFQRNGFEWLLAKEIERAKRKDYTLALMLIQITPFEKISTDIGVPATERLLFQIGETLQNICRAYDNIFKIDTHTFAVFFTETQHSHVEPILKRIQRRLEKTSFLVSTDRIKITPNFKWGASLYPIDGTNPQSLEMFARQNLSETFSTPILRTAPKASNEIFEVLPSVKPIEAQNLSEPEVVLNVVNPVDLVGTPEMNDFQNELKNLFERTSAVEATVNKMISEDTDSVAPILEQVESKNSNETNSTDPTLSIISTDASSEDTSSEVQNENTNLESEFDVPTRKVHRIKSLNIEPLPAGLSYFDQKEKRKTLPSDSLSNSLDETLQALQDEPSASEHNIEPTKIENDLWSVEELAQMPDVVMAIMQNEIEQPFDFQNNVKIERKTVNTKINKIDIVQNEGAPVIHVDFQK